MYERIVAECEAEEAALGRRIAELRACGVPEEERINMLLCIRETVREELQTARKARNRGARAQIPATKIKARGIMDEFEEMNIHPENGKKAARSRRTEPGQGKPPEKCGPEGGRGWQ